MSGIQLFSILAVLCLCFLSVCSAISPLARVHRNARKSAPTQLRDPVIDPDYQWQQFIYTQRRDHFNFQSSSATFKEKVLINDTWWHRPDAEGRGAGPIFFYAGNEGPIELFATNSGFMWDLAPQYNALLVFPEHRYYGSSMPIDDDPVKSMSLEGIQFLTAEQAMADYAEFAVWLRRNLTTVDAPIILFGGSYGGMLASWMRIKYPAIFAGAVASSAPIWQYEGMYDPAGFNGVLTRDAADASPLCPLAFNASWDIMASMAQTQAGRDQIQQIFHVCDPITTPDTVTSALYGYITEAVGDLAMVDYPYASTFLGDIPAKPINVMCSNFTQEGLSNATLLLSQLHGAIGVYYNYSGGLSCYNLTAPAGISTLGDYDGWNYQSCTEMIMPIGQYGLPKDMFWYAPWNLTDDVLGCEQQFPGIVPRPYWAEVNLASKDLSGTSNIVFTNGNLDPWGPGGVWQNFSSSVLAFEVVGGAHHLDLRHETPFDPPGVLWVRAAIRQQIDNWIAGVTPGNSCSDNNSFPNPLQAGFIGGAVGIVALLIIWRGVVWYRAADPAKGQTERAIADRPNRSSAHDEPVITSAPLAVQRQSKTVNGGGYQQLNA